MTYHSNRDYEKVECKMYCPKCDEEFEIKNPYLKEFFVMEECDKCNEDGEFKFKECIF